MIVRRLHLHPFAGTADREVCFAPGLNVVLGPNEAGKTTLRRALRQVLFVPTTLTKRQAESEVLPYLPLRGGDTVRVSVDLVSGERVWKLTKRWTGGNSTSELQLPDGGILSEASAVANEVSALLGLSQGTWEHVLFATQGGVGSSLDRLGDRADTDDLNEVMRRAVFETDGVSLEALAARIDERWAGAYGRWDRGLKRPEGNRGLDNAWARGAGSIVTVWYEKERARLALNEAESYYRRLDELNARLGAALAESETLRNWVEGHTALARDTEQRAGLEGRLAQVEAKGSGLRQISQEWPVVDSKRLEQETLAAELKEKSGVLALELAKAKTEAEAWEAAGKIRRLLEEAEKLQTRLATAVRERDASPLVEAAQIEALERLEQERVRIRARLEAASLRVVFHSGQAITLETRAGVGEKLVESLEAGGKLEFTAGGRVSVREAGGGWSLEVSSGDIDVTGEETRFREIETEAAALLEKTGSADLADARNKQRVFQEKSRDAALLGKQLKDLLGPNRTLESLRAELKGTDGRESISPPARNTADLAADHARTEAAAAAAGKEANTLRNRVAEWTQKFQSSDALLDLLLELRGEHQTLKSSLDALLPLPGEFADARTFLDEFRGKKEALDQRKSVMNQVLVEKAAFEGQAPALEPADAAEQLAQSTAAFERALREGEAIEKIRNAFQALRTEMDEGTLDPWLAHLSEVITPLTLDRYREIQLDGTASREDALNIPFSALSAGTRACLGLAVRLSMARWFLDGRDGFLLLDDPLVDLDPERQESAAAILKHFAKDKQVILLTCHPRHAEILGGTLVTL